MILGMFPLGAAALHPDWPLARFNISGAFAFHALVLQFMDLAEQGFGCQVPIDSIHGAPALSWNSGRYATAAYNPDTFGSMLACLYSKNVGCHATFTNHLLEEADLDDSVGNSILNYLAMHPERNAVILSSDLLSAYIARKYPRLRQIASIIKVTVEQGHGHADYYRDLGRRFHRYVVHPDDCRDLDLLDQLDRDKAEIIINENCAPHCGNRARHYENTARLQKATAAGDADREALVREMRQIMADCQAPLDKHSLSNRRRSCALTTTEIRAIYDMGFRHFKIQGRGGFVFNYIYDLIRLTLDPEIAAPMVTKTMCSIMHGG